MRSLTHAEYHYFAAQLARDHKLITDYVSHVKPHDYATHIETHNREIAQLAALPDFDHHASELATVARWVLFVLDHNSEYEPLTNYETFVYRAAERLDGVFQLIEKREGTLLTK